MARIKPEFDKRGSRSSGSRRPGRQPRKVGNDIKETQGFAPKTTDDRDTDFNVSKLYGMLSGQHDRRPGQADGCDNQTVRNVFVVGPDKKIKLILVYR